MFDGTNIDPYCPPHPHPQRQQKSPASGQAKLRKNNYLMIFYEFEKRKEEREFINKSLKKQ